MISNHKIYWWIIQYDLVNNTLLGPVEAYWADFGLGRQLSCDPNKRSSNFTMEVYTATYRPPEIISGHSDYDEKADTWALGVTHWKV